MDRLSTLTNVQVADLRALDFCRWIQALHGARGRVDHAVESFAEAFPRALSTKDLLTKAASLPATTTDPAWAGSLIAPLSISFLAGVRQQEVVSRLSGTLPVVPGVALPVYTFTPTAAITWRAEAAAKPVVPFTFSATTLRPFKIPALIVASAELLKLETDAARTLRDLLILQITAAVNREFLDPARAPVLNVSPGSITNAGTSIPPTGNVPADAATALAALVTARPAVVNPTLIVSPIHAQKLIATGQQPDLTFTGGSAFGAQVIVSAAAGTTITAIDPSAVYLWDPSDGVTVDISKQASLQLRDDPLVGADAAPVSMWENNLIAMRGERAISWKLTAATACQYVTES